MRSPSAPIGSGSGGFRALGILWKIYLPVILTRLLPEGWSGFCLLRRQSCLLGEDKVDLHQIWLKCVEEWRREARWTHEEGEIRSSAPLAMQAGDCSGVCLGNAPLDKSDELVGAPGTPERATSAMGSYPIAFSIDDHAEVDSLEPTPEYASLSHSH
jgi:hypothetical protein